MVYIYCITNKVNNKKYVGSTNDIERRSREHYTDAYNKNKVAYNYPLQRAIRKYTWSNFIFEVLEVSSKENSSEREKDWIIKLNTLVKNNHGYNQSLDTECAMRDPELQKYFTYKNQPVVGVLLTDSNDRVYYNSIKEAAEKEGIRREGISGCINGNPKFSHSGGRVWRKIEEENSLSALIKDGQIITDGKAAYSKKIAIVDDSNNTLKVFLSRVEAAKWLIENKYAKGEVSSVAKHLSQAIKKNKKAYKMLWKDLS